MRTILGLLTLAGLALMALGIVAGVQGFAWDERWLRPLVGVGWGCFLLAGIVWAHTRGKRVPKIALLGAVGFLGGGALGLFLLDKQRSILLLIVGSWALGILIGCCGVAWGIIIHRPAGPGPDYAGLAGERTSCPECGFRYLAEAGSCLRCDPRR
jgi:hypothetical protein